jgi:LPXTG-motif cell wall-anchored protein
MPDFMGETWFMVSMGLALLALIGLLLFLRNRKTDDE